MNGLKPRATKSCTATNQRLIDRSSTAKRSYATGTHLSDRALIGQWKRLWESLALNFLRSTHGGT